jgi:hypothetical protein
VSSTITTTEPSTGNRAGSSVRAFSVAQVAEMYHVKQHLVLSWISNGSLRAIDTRKHIVTSKKPRWKILPKDLDAFEESRASKPEPKHTRKAAAKPTVEPIGRRW